MTDIDEIKYWQTQLDTMRRTQLDTVRATAVKWQGSISTLLGLFGTVAFVGGNDSIEKLDAADADRVKLAISAAVALAAVGVIAATYAASGITRRTSNPTWRWLEQRSRGQARNALRALRISQVASMLAVAVVVAGSLVVLFNTDPKPEDKGPSFVIASADGKVFCGELHLAADGTVEVSTAQGAHVAVSKDRPLTSVASCPK